MSLTWLYIFAFFFSLDLALTFIAKRRRLSVKNVYFQLNLKYGYLKLSLLKVGLALLHIWFLIDPRLSNGRIELVMIYYYLLILKLFIDVLQALSKETR